MFDPQLCMPSETFSNYVSLKKIAQATCVATSLSSGVAFYLSETFASRLAFTISNSQSTFNKISWIPPVLGIGITSVAAYKFYAESSSFLLKGLICGVHSTAMMLFSYTPPTAGVLSFTALRDRFRPLFLNPDGVKNLEEKKRLLIDSRSEIAASVAFLASSISLTLILQNPILANTIAYPVAALVKVVATRDLEELAIL